MGFVLDLLGGGAISGLLGGITGLAGTWLKGRHEREMAALRGVERDSDREHEIAVIQMETAGAVEVAKIERQEADDVASGQALTASFGMEPKRFSDISQIPDNWIGNWIIGPIAAILMFSLDFVRGVTRPGLTIYLAILVTMIFFTLKSLMDDYGMAITPDQVMELALYMVNVISYLFITVVLWWFGDRNRNAPPAMRT